MALTGHQLFATEVDGLQRLDEKTFTDTKDLYIFGEGMGQEYEVISDPNPIKNDRRSATVHKLYPSSVQNHIAQRDKKKSEMVAHEKMQKMEENGREKHEDHHINADQGDTEHEVEHEQKQEDLKHILKDIKKGGYREADAKGKYAAIQARSGTKQNHPAKNPSRDDVYNKHFEKHKNAFGE